MRYLFRRVTPYLLYRFVCDLSLDPFNKHQTFGHMCMAPIQTDSPASRLTLLPVQDIKSCTALANEIAERLRADGCVTIDASAFASGDITFVQTLFAARKAAEALGGTVRMDHGNAAIAALFGRCGVDTAGGALFVSDSLEDTP